jgi:hypothetical protein
VSNIFNPSHWNGNEFPTHLEQASSILIAGKPAGELVRSANGDPQKLVKIAVATNGDARQLMGLVAAMALQNPQEGTQKLPVGVSQHVSSPPSAIVSLSSSIPPPPPPPPPPPASPPPAVPPSPSSGSGQSLQDLIKQGVKLKKLASEEVKDASAPKLGGTDKGKDSFQLALKARLTARKTGETSPAPTAPTAPTPTIPEKPTTVSKPVLRRSAFRPDALSEDKDIRNEIEKIKGTKSTPLALRMVLSQFLDVVKSKAQKGIGQPDEVKKAVDTLLEYTEAQGLGAIGPQFSPAQLRPAILEKLGL